MTIIKRLSVSICCFISYTLNGIFGWGQGENLYISIVLCIGAISFDIYKSFALGIANKCYQTKQYGKFGAAVSLYTLGTTLSLLAAFGFYAQLLDAKTGSAKAEKLQYETLKKEKVASQRELKALGKHRAVAAIKAEIDGEKSKERYWSAKLSNKCTNATAGKSKALCNKISALKVELAKAEDALPKIKQLKKRIDKLNNKLDEVDLEVVSKSNDAQIEGIAKNTGIDGGVVALLISIIFALAFEAISGLGFYILDGEKKYKEALLQQYQDALQSKKRENIKVTDDREEENSLNNFIELYLEKDNGGELFLDETYNIYENWCSINGISKVHLNVFSREIQFLLKKKTGRKRIEGKLKRFIKGYKLINVNIVNVSNFQ